MSEFISVADVCPTGFAREQKEVRDEVAEIAFRLRREMEEQGGFAQTGARRRTYTWRSAHRREGDVKVYKTSETPEKRVNDSVGEYVEFEEIDTDKKG